VITGIGHEIDFQPFADFAADVRAPDALCGRAELAVPDAEEWLNAFVRFGARLQRCMRRRLEERSASVCAGSPGRAGAREPRRTPRRGRPQTLWIELEQGLGPRAAAPGLHEPPRAICVG